MQNQLFLSADRKRNYDWQRHGVLTHSKEYGIDLIYKLSKMFGNECELRFQAIYDP